jgi:hypothetical protein
MDGGVGLLRWVWEWLLIDWNCTDKIHLSAGDMKGSVAQIIHLHFLDS